MIQAETSNPSLLRTAGHLDLSSKTVKTVPLQSTLAHASGRRALSRYATQSGDAPRYRISLDQRGGRKSTEANRGV